MLDIMFYHSSFAFTIIFIVHAWTLVFGCPSCILQALVWPQPWFSGILTCHCLSPDFPTRKHIYSLLTFCIVPLSTIYKFMCIPGIPMHLVKSTCNFQCPYSIIFLHEHMAFITDPAHNLRPSFFCDPSMEWIFH